MTDMRRCIGSKTYGIEPHEAPASDFPVQPSQRDGLGRMCRRDWNLYTNALRKAALARKAGHAETVPAEVAVADEVKPEKARACSGSALRRARPADADHPAGSIADSTPVPDAAPSKKVKAPKPESARVGNARAVVAATETLAGNAYTDAVGTDEVQAALAVLGSRGDTGEPSGLAEEEIPAA